MQLWISLPLLDKSERKERRELEQFLAERDMRLATRRRQWRSIAERAPDNATADYFHEVFAPTARAIDGLEKALAGLGLLDDALALDLRCPQDYFHRLWNIGFRPADLVRASDDAACLNNESGGDVDNEQEIPA